MRAHGDADMTSAYRPLRTPQQALQQEQARHEVTRMALQVAQHQLEGLKQRCQERSALLTEAQEYGHASQREADELRASLQQQHQLLQQQQQQQAPGPGSDSASSGESVQCMVAPAARAGAARPAQSNAVSRVSSVQVPTDGEL